MAKTQAEIDAEHLENQKIQLALAAQQLEQSLKAPARAETLYESVESPRTLVRILTTGSKPYFCVLEIEGTEPYRHTTSEERQRGILSLAPVAVRARTALKLIEVGSVALQTAIYATPGYEWGGENGLGAGDLAMIHYKTTRAIRAALRTLGEDV